MIAKMFLLLSLLASPEPPRTDLQRLWVDWRAISRDAAEAERERARSPADPARAQALGARVGALVAAGDCEGGERMAREAGDFALVDAVRRHCRAADPRR